MSIEVLVAQSRFVRVTHPSNVNIQGDRDPDRSQPGSVVVAALGRGTTL
jgi:hypothetical protein